MQHMVQCRRAAHRCQGAHGYGERCVERVGSFGNTAHWQMDPAGIYDTLQRAHLDIQVTLLMAVPTPTPAILPYMSTP